MPSAEPLLRTPLPSEAEAVARLQLDCWRDAYTDLVDPARLAASLADVDGRTRVWTEVISGPSRVVVAESGRHLVGFASLQPSTPQAPAHLASLYVRAAYWSTGLGQRLLDAVLERDEPATLGVFRDNYRARRFYARNAFVPDGTEREDAHWGGAEIGMVRPAP